MNINNQSQVNFNAKFLHNVSIKRLDNKTGEYKKFKAAFIEFEPQNKRDLEVIEHATDNWHGETYARNIANKALKMSNSELSPKLNHIFMVTSQKDNFENLKWEKLLGIAHLEVESIDENELKYLQVRPDTKHGKDNRKYKDIGAKIIESLKAKYNTSIRLIAFYKASGFYNKHGFKLVDPELLEYVWRHKKFNS